MDVPPSQPVAAIPSWSPAAFEVGAQALLPIARAARLEAAALLAAAPASIAALCGASPAAPRGETRITAYYEPVLEGRRHATPGFQVPVLGMPYGYPRPLPARAEIAAGALAGHAPVLAWLTDPVDLFFLQIQGSGRIALDDGSDLRLGYAGRNGHDYVSIGNILRRRGTPIGAGGLRRWLREDRRRGTALMNRNPSYIFFAVRDDLAPSDGPVGAWGRPLPSGGHAVAVDPAHHAYGSLLWIERDDRPGDGRLAMAMDTGSAIRGPGRIDLFIGNGADAGRTAGRVNTRGRVWRLCPDDPGP